MTVAIIFSADDARRFIREKPRADAVISLTPAACAELKGESVPVVITSDIVYSDCSHARTAARASRAFERFQSTFKPPVELGLAASLLLEHRINSLAVIGLRAWMSVGSTGPWLIPVLGEWRLTNDRHEAQMHVVNLAIGSGERLTRKVAVPFPQIYRALRWLVVAMVARRRRWIAGPGDYRQGITEIIKADPTLGMAALKFGSSGRETYRALAVGAARHILGRRAGLDVMLVPRWNRVPLTSGYLHAFRIALEAIRDEPVQYVLNHLAEPLADSTRLSNALAFDAEAVIRHLRPALCLYQISNSIYTAPVADGAAKACAQTAILNYNSLSARHGPRARAVSKRLARLRYANSLWSFILCWSPHGSEIAEASKNSTSSRLLPVRLVDNSVERERGNAKFHILHADNYHEWIHSQPLIVQTSDEFVTYTRKLLKVVAALPEIDVEIRLKRKSECDPEIFKKLVDVPANVSVSDIKVPFSRRVAVSDLVISFMSTTIEEALAARVPVLLWGPTRRYVHLPARAIPPTRSDRAAVYQVSSEEMLQPMIMAIREAHLGAPLTDAEVSPYLWDAATPTLKETILALAAGRT